MRLPLEWIQIEVNSYERKTVKQLLNPLAPSPCYGAKKLNTYRNVHLRIWASVLAVGLVFGCLTLHGQQQTTSEEAEDEEEETIEEMVVVGSQMKGADVTGILPVSVFESDDIDVLGFLQGTNCWKCSPNKDKISSTKKRTLVAV